MKKIFTKSGEETRQLGRELAGELKGGEVICLEGDLGSGKTTFTQGLLDGLGADGPYTSPTFVVMKKYDVKKNEIASVYHIDTYRVNSDELLELGWNEIAGNKNCVLIVEWPERVENIIPENAIRMRFSWIDENEREIVLK